MLIAVRMKVNDPNPCLTLSVSAMNHTLHADLWIHMYIYCIEYMNECIRLHVHVIDSNIK